MQRRGYIEWDSSKSPPLEESEPNTHDLFADPDVQERMARLIAMAALGERDKKLN